MFCGSLLKSEEDEKMIEKEGNETVTNCHQLKMGIKMEAKNKIQLFQEQKVRTYWDETLEKWFFSIIDVVAILTESPRPRKYWNALKTKLQTEGSQLSQDMGQLKMQVAN
ncbi:MAG: hypothetical protein U9P73_01755 [Candidatus Cloacimonadota bacterium]|nr:hypothetical protein [Candidatus Cloacimonadota bacterium]